RGARSAPALGPRYRAMRHAMQDTAQVPSPISISQVVRRATIKLLPNEQVGLGPVGEGLDEGVDQVGVIAAGGAPGAPMLETALVSPAGDGLGRDVEPPGGLGAGQPLAGGLGHGGTHLRPAREARVGGGGGGAQP